MRRKKSHLCLTPTDKQYVNNRTSGTLQSSYGFNYVRRRRRRQSPACCQQCRQAWPIGLDCRGLSSQGPAGCAANIWQGRRSAKIKSLVAKSEVNKVSFLSFFFFSSLYINELDISCTFAQRLFHSFTTRHRQVPDRQRLLRSHCSHRCHCLLLRPCPWLLRPPL